MSILASEIAHEVLQHDTGLGSTTVIAAVTGAFAFVAALVWYFLKVALPAKDVTAKEDRDSCAQALKETQQLFREELTAEREQRQQQHVETTGTAQESTIAMVRLNDSIVGLSSQIGDMRKSVDRNTEATKHRSRRNPTLQPMAPLADLEEPR